MVEAGAEAMAEALVVVMGEQAVVAAGGWAVRITVTAMAAPARQVEAREVQVQEEQQKWAPVAHAAKPVIDRTVLPVQCPAPHQQEERIDRHFGCDG